jgi:radical SAM superfamily enzyme YgiQ (UPF0313 family)
MKILLIFPKYPYNSKSFSVIAPLSLPILASFFPPEFEVFLIDENVDCIDFSIPVDYVLISAYTLNIKRGYEIADHFREKNVPVLMGGVHVSFYPTEAHLHADSVCIGEVEGIVDDLINDMRKGSLKEIYNSTQYSELVNLPLPRRDLLNRNAYHFINSINISRGCPHRCHFCSVSAFNGKKYRFRPISDIQNELNHLIENARGMERFFYITDSHFAANKSFTIKLLQMFKRLKKFSYVCFITAVKAGDKEILELLKQTSCASLLIGFESVVQGSISNMRKKHNKIEDYKMIIKRIHEYGIPIQGSFVFGFDGEQKNVFEQTFDFCQENCIDVGMFSILTPYIGTDLRLSLEKQKRIIHNDWNLYDSMEVVYEPVGMTIDELKQGNDTINKEYYTDEAIKARFKISPKTMSASIGATMMFKNTIDSKTNKQSV